MIIIVVALNPLPVELLVWVGIGAWATGVATRFAEIVVETGTQTPPEEFVEGEGRMPM
jgi:hypothetical protein